MAAGAAILIAADVTLARMTSVLGLLVGIGLWGLHLGLTEGVFAALVADTAPAHLRGTAFGLFNLAGGTALLAASIVAGSVWELAGPAATFYTGAVFAAICLVALLLQRLRYSGRDRRPLG